ncbi:DUF4136 domain-containing protein, partial [bacterium]|nr:DUF4136 domain-containing protein [bacterium]
MPKPRNMPANAQRAMQRNPLLDKRIRNAINDQLAAKGLQMTSSAPDILIAYHTGVQDKIDVVIAMPELAVTMPSVGAE